MERNRKRERERAGYANKLFLERFSWSACPNYRHKAENTRREVRSGYGRGLAGRRRRWRRSVFGVECFLKCFLNVCPNCQDLGREEEGEGEIKRESTDYNISVHFLCGGNCKNHVWTTDQSCSNAANSRGCVCMCVLTYTKGVEKYSILLSVGVLSCFNSCVGDRKSVV